MRDPRNITPLVTRTQRHQKSERVDDQAAADYLSDDRAVFRAVRSARIDRQICSDADDEKKKWKNQIRRRPAIPLGVLERRINRRPRPRIVHEEHSGDRQSAEHIEREQPLPLWRQRRYGRAWLSADGSHYYIYA